MSKSVTKIKDETNGEVFLSEKDSDSDEKRFLTEWVQDIKSEWRVFVFNKKVRGIQCYSGDEWTLPNKDYVERVVKSCDELSYTLDVMVRENGETDIVELHDFFACGLYGFEDHASLLNMWVSTIRKILKN